MKQFLQHVAFTALILGVLFSGMSLYARNKSPIDGYGGNQSDSDEATRPNSGENSLLAVVNQSTGTNPDILTRRLTANDLGMLRTVFAVPKSSFITTDYSTTSNIINGIPVTTATYFYVSTGGPDSTQYFGDQPTIAGISTSSYNNNLTVFCIGSSSQPCSNLKLAYGVEVNGQALMSRVRVYNSRGSTVAANTMVWDGYMSSTITQTIEFNQEFSSGVTVLNQGGSIHASWIPPVKGSDGLTR